MKHGIFISHGLREAIKDRDLAGIVAIIETDPSLKLIGKSAAGHRRDSQALHRIGLGASP
jgi:hypothetical protein